MGIKTEPWDVTEHLDSDEAIAAYLEAVLEDGDAALFTAALGDVARARGMTELAEAAGMSRSGLYKALGEGGNPSFGTVLELLKAVGVRLSAEPVHKAEAA